MKLPGQAVLEFEIFPSPTLPGKPAPSCNILVQTARFQPRGLAGLAYWYAVLPLHSYVFRGMLAGIQRQAEQSSGSIAAV